MTGTSFEHAIATIDDVLTSLAEARPVAVDALEMADEVGPPYKAACAAAALLWRTEELGRCARTLLNGRDVAAALVLTRALIESAAAIWYLMRLVEQNTDCLEADCDDKITRLLIGTKSDDDLPKAINVLTMLGHAGKDVPQVQASYADLCEFAHPNWSGTGHVYSWIDEEASTTYFGTMHRAHGQARERCVGTLRSALVMAQVAYARIQVALPAFTRACSLDLDRLGSPDQREAAA
jgi:hypothetical protein